MEAASSRGEQEDLPYQDYASLIDVGEGEPKTRGCINNFPAKLHYMLSEVEKDGHEDIVGWQPHGRCFLIRDQEKFVKQILPFWFRQTKFTSFQRQLNLYCFKRLSSGDDKHGYYHERFLRGKGFLVQHMQRVKVKGVKLPPQSPEPNFYAMPFLPSSSAAAHQNATPQQQWNSIDSHAGTISSNGISRASTAPTMTSFLPGIGAGVMSRGLGEEPLLAVQFAGRQQRYGAVQTALSNAMINDLLARASLNNSAVAAHQQQQANVIDRMRLDNLRRVANQMSANPILSPVSASRMTLLREDPTGRDGASRDNVAPLPHDDTHP